MQLRSYAVYSAKKMQIHAADIYSGGILHIIVVVSTSPKHPQTFHINLTHARTVLFYINPSPYFLLRGIFVVVVFCFKTL